MKESFRCLLKHVSEGKIMVITPLFSATGAKISLGLLPTSHASPSRGDAAFYRVCCERLVHALLHHRTGNNILRSPSGEPGLTDLHGNLRPVMHAVQHCLRQSLAIGNGHGS